MRAGSSMKVFAGCALLNLGAQAQRWPVKTVDLSDKGALCDTSTEQYLQVECYDFHDHPKFTMRWRQLTGPCGEAIPASDLLSWETSYDSTNGDSVPTERGRVQLDLFVCCPFGDYELELVVESYSDDGSKLQQRTAWEIENGPDEYHIWDTVNTYLADDEDYSPTVPGTYTWPLKGETGYYKTLYAGTLPPLMCSSSVPSGTEYVGCFEDSGNNRLLDSDSMELEEMGTDGMTNQICSDFCSDYDYFGLRSGSQCYCGTAAELNGAGSSDDCGTNYEDLCTGDSTSACGSNNAISVYERTGGGGGGGPSPTEKEGGEYVGCYEDSTDSRALNLEGKNLFGDMTNEACIEFCADNGHPFSGTQYSSECWCGVTYDLNGEATDPDDRCDFDCEGDSSQICGGLNALSVYTTGV